MTLHSFRLVLLIGRHGSTLREIQLLRHLKHENIIDIMDMWEHGNDIYLAEVLMEADLHQV